MQKILKGDNVKILIGKDNGKTGNVDKVLVAGSLVSVSGVNSYKRHVKAYQGVEGGIIELGKPVKISNVALICPSCSKATRVGFLIEDGVKKRVCKKCKKVIETKKEKK